MYKEIASNKRKTAVFMSLFIAFIMGIGYVFGAVNGSGYSGLVLAAIFSLIMTLFSYFSGDKVALMSSGAKRITKEQNPYIYRMTENLCIATGLPVPKIYIINDPAPNAFATGRNPENASIALTTGIIELLENEELEGVIAHELAHIQNYDIRLATVVIALIGTISIMVDMMWHNLFWGRGDDNRPNNPVFLIIGIALIILSPIIGSIIQLAISRKREFLADATGALMTRYPEGLANALRKISTYSQPMQRVNEATAHLYIANPFGKKKSWKNLFSTHPPVEERIAALSKMA